jgi:hypothetical protein
VSGRGVEGLGSVEVDGGLGLGEVEGVRPGVVVEVLDPVVAGKQTDLHGVAHVGEDTGREAGALEGLRPLDHGKVELAPEIDVGGDEGFDLDGTEKNSGVATDVVPIGPASEVAPVVGVAVGPVAAVEEFLVEVGDGAHLRPGCGIGWAGEDHAVVEEDCLDRAHAAYDFTGPGRQWGR